MPGIEQKPDNPMKIHTNQNDAARSCLALVLALAVWTPLHAQPADGMDGKMMMAGKMMMDGRAEMLDAKMKMMEGRLMMLEGRGMMDGKSMMEGKPMLDRKMMKDCQEMMARKQKMKEDTAVQNAALTEEVAAMNRAPDDKKMSLMAGIITHLVEQKDAMDARKAKMEEDMMKHMMAHMKMGGESMMQCPMMKDMKDMDKKPEPAEKPEDAHKEHHE